MRVLFISDIHGIKTNLPKIKERFEKLNCDKLVIYLISCEGKSTNIVVV